MEKVMASFGKSSKEKLATCDPRLQEILNEVIKIRDISILCGHRGEEEQNKAFNGGNSKLKFPQSKHNSQPSKAVDIAPYDKGIDWENREKFFELAGIVKAIAHTKGIKIRWGGDFTSFFDGPHYELVD
jgi:hypothetical protein